jgi:hypothetical protein
VGDHADLGSKKSDVAQPVALGAGAHRIVEREQARLELRPGLKLHTGQANLAENQMFGAAVHFHRDRAAIGMA